jgi:hypothetical protein
MSVPSDRSRESFAAQVAVIGVMIIVAREVRP